MILFFRTPTNSVIATECSKELNSEDIKKIMLAVQRRYCRSGRKPLKAGSSVHDVK